MAANPRLAQLSRMLRRELPSVADASGVIAADPASLAAALVSEAAASDDVTSAPTAMDYLESRLADLSDFLDGATAAAVRRSFAANVGAWSRPPPG